MFGNFTCLFIFTPSNQISEARIPDPLHNRWYAIAKMQCPGPARVLHIKSPLSSLRNAIGYERMI